MKPGVRVAVLKILLVGWIVAGTALAGGGRPLQSSSRPHTVAVLQETDHVSVRVGDTLRILMVEAPYEDGRRWTILNRSPGLKLLARSETPQGDHGYFSLIFDIAYLYKVLPGASDSLTLRFALTNNGPIPPESQTFIRQLTVTVIR